MNDIPPRLVSALAGRYRIERALGEGGMATVYLADDLKHERKVALKVLKPELAAVVGAERFLAEIKTTANLQHPHILPLYDSGQADSFLFYVMPWVQGETLRERLDREKQLPVEEAVRLASAVAGALDYAHRHGVVHRDIKPGNILMQDGQPVVGDFGIALAVGSAGGARLTETGLSVGTPFYMSPEQATGDVQVGPASDIYALGAVLYELLTGEPPYMGTTAQAVLGKIIQGQPVSATAVRRAVPVHVDAAIRRSLEKLPADRFTHASDFAKALADPSFRHGEATPLASSASGRRWKVASLALAATSVVLAGLLIRAANRPEAPRPVERFSLRTEAQQVPWEYLALKPDGSAMVTTYNRRRGEGSQDYRIVLKRWSDDTPVVVYESDELPWDPIVSPDGTEVAFVDGNRYVLKAAPLDGGLVRTLTEEASCCLRWAGDGYVYFTGTGGNIRRVPGTGGPAEDVTTLQPEDDGEHDYWVPVPGRNAGLFWANVSEGRIEALDRDTGTRTVVTEGVRPWLTRSGHLVFGTLDGRILAAPFDAGTLTLAGPPVPLVEGVYRRITDPAFTLSEQGDLLYWRGENNRSQGEFVWISRDGVVSPVTGIPSFEPGTGNLAWSLSPDGRRAAYMDTSVDLGAEIWIQDLVGGQRSRLTFNPGQDWSPQWSADGRTVYFASDRAGGSGKDIWAQAADGTGEARLVLESERDITDFSMSTDGAWVVFRVGGPPSRDIYAQRPGVDDAPIPVAASPDYDEIAPTLSPDGRWIAYSSDETGDREVYVRPFPEVGAGRWQISSGGGSYPRWSPDGRELYFWGREGLTVAEVDARDGFQIRSTRQLFGQLTLRRSTVSNTWYDVSPDAQRFLAVRPAGEQDGAGPELILVQNFLEQVKRAVPK